MRHRRDETTDARRATPRFIATVAERPATVLAAQRLRHRVFHPGSSLAPDHPDAVDRDAAAAAAVCRRLVPAYLGPEAWRVFPNVAFRTAGPPGAKEVEVPPLIKAYLHFGAAICGEPAWDPVFRTADLLMMLPMARVRARLLRDDGGPRAPQRRARWAA